MIFVTVGTHEQQFNRLVECVDNLKRDGKITENVFIQTGYSTYEPQHCTWSKFVPFDQMKQYYADADIIITHGGPASFIDALKIGKTPIVVPRQAQFEEHVNNHQVEFAEQVANRMGTIIPVFKIEDLEATIRDFKEISRTRGGMASNNEQFTAEFAKIIDSLFPEEVRR